MSLLNHQNIYSRQHHNKECIIPAKIYAMRTKLSNVSILKLIIICLVQLDKQGQQLIEKWIFYESLKQLIIEIPMIYYCLLKAKWSTRSSIYYLSILIIRNSSQVLKFTQLKNRAYIRIAPIFTIPPQIKFKQSKCLVESHRQKWWKYQINFKHRGV